MTQLLTAPTTSLAGARSFTEYLAMFGLTPAELAGRRVLDAGAGASAFTAGALARGLDAVAVDPAYPDADGDRRAALASLGLTAEDDVRRFHKRVVAEPDAFRWVYFTDPEDHQRRRLAAARYFAAHAAQQPDRYVRGEPHALPFDDDAFDLVLAPSLPDGSALPELLRVAPEVRVFPDLEVPRLVGVTLRRRPTTYAFSRGADEVLVLSR